VLLDTSKILYQNVAIVAYMLLEEIMMNLLQHQKLKAEYCFEEVFEEDSESVRLLSCCAFEDCQYDMKEVKCKMN